MEAIGINKKDDLRGLISRRRPDLDNIAITQLVDDIHNAAVHYETANRINQDPRAVTRLSIYDPYTEHDLVCGARSTGAGGEAYVGIFMVGQGIEMIGKSYLNADNPTQYGLFCEIRGPRYWHFFGKRIYLRGNINHPPFLSGCGIMNIDSEKPLIEQNVTFITSASS